MNSAPMLMSEVDRCGDQCVACARACVKALYHHCLTAGGAHVAVPHVQLMTDCSEMCTVAANFMTRGSPRHAAVCSLCADLCQACAEDCATLGGMEESVSACQECAKSCRAMAG